MPGPFNMDSIRGRPPRVQEGLGETPPKGKPRIVSTVRSNASLKKQISGMLMTLNLALIMIPPLRQDVLDMTEIDALATALDEQAKVSKRFRQALETALAAGTGGNLLGIMAIIGARRAARHGMLPQEADQMLGNLLAQGLDAARTPPHVAA